MNIIYVAYENQDFGPQIDYVFDLIFSIYGIDYTITPLKAPKLDGLDLTEGVVISYGRECLDTGAKKQIHIYASGFFGKDYLEPSSMPETPLKKYDDLPVIYAGHGGFEGWVRKTEGLIETNIDIIASCFFMVSRYEEVVSDVKDQYERFPAKASLAYKEGFLDRPIVNEYIELLWSWIKSLQPELARKALWPNNKDFAVCLTHDVDSVKRYSLLPPVISIGSAILRHGNFRLGFNMASDYLGALFHLKKDPFDTFDYIIKLEESLGFKSSFYFKAGGNSDYDSGDTVKRTRVKRLVKRLAESGCEIGLHASYNSYDSLESMTSEKNEMDKVAGNKSYGCRQHYIRWKTPDTWRLQEKAGLLYDNTLSFADHAGFRCGICLPFQPFDVMENRRLNIWELPLTVMEGSLQNPNYQNLPPDVGYKEIIKHIETVKRFSGVFVLLWHNSSFDRLGGWAGWKDVYERIMQYISKQNAFVASGRAIVELWQQNLSLS